MIAHFLRTLAASLLLACIGWAIVSEPPIELLFAALIGGLGLTTDTFVHSPHDVLQPRWLYLLLVLAGTVLGIELLIGGDTAERVFGVLLTLPGLLMGGALAWAVWKFRQERRRDA